VRADNAKPGAQDEPDSRLDVPAEPPDAIPLAPSIYQDPKDPPSGSRLERRPGEDLEVSLEQPSKRQPRFILCLSG
jgi:hypothetical protein